MRRPILFAAVLSIVVWPAAFATDLEKLPSAANDPELYVSTERPQNTNPVPTALFLHVAGGMIAKQVASQKEWSEWLRERGMAFVSVQRGRSPRAQGYNGDLAAYIAMMRQRADDARRALEWLSSTGWADPRRLLIVGQSQGGSVGILGAVDGTLAVPHVALYPPCAIRQEPPTRLERFPKSLWILGEYDPIARAKDCIAMHEMFLRAGAPAIELVTLPKAYHEFDFPTLETKDNGGATMLFSAEARDRARLEVEKFLRGLGYVR